MALTTYFVVLPFTVGKRGRFAALEAKEALSADAACRMAERLAAEHGGAIAFSRAGDADLGDYDDAVVLQVCGQVPRETLDAARAA